MQPPSPQETASAAARETHQQLNQYLGTEHAAVDPFSASVLGSK